MFSIDCGNQMMHLLKKTAVVGGLLQFVAFGGGSFSLDRRRATDRSVFDS